MKTIVLQRVPDGYRGDLDCLAVVTPHKEIGCTHSGHGHDYKVHIVIDETVAGTLFREHGNNGGGKPACDTFYPAEGWKVEYDDYDDDDDD